MLHSQTEPRHDALYHWLTLTDQQRHRGAHPDDAVLFAPEALEGLRVATHQLSWLLTRGYNITSAIALVGNRHALRARQRLAVQRAACTDEHVHERAKRRRPTTELAGSTVLIDGFNCIIGLEAALGGGVLVEGRDGVLRDMASVHGTYRHVAETTKALEKIAETLVAAGVTQATCWLDKPVSNSGRLAARIRDVLGERLPTTVELVNNPDRALIDHATEGVVCSGDAFVIDNVNSWLDLPAATIAHCQLDAWRIELGDRGQDAG